MAQQPQRPFESLDWYRHAARRGFVEDDHNRGLVPILAGSGLLRAHISVFAVISVLLVAINLLRTPESIWVDRWLMAWMVLLLIHCVAVGVVWAIRQWNDEDPDEPVRLSPNGWQQAPVFGWGAPGTPPPPAQEAEFRPSAEPEGPAPWADWSKVTERPEIPESERASWSEATVTSWLERRSRQTGTAQPAETPKDEDKQDA